MLAYIINLGMYSHPGSVQWRFPLLFQLVFCAYILAVAPWLPDTPRWLMRHETSPDRGLQVLAKLRNKPIDDIVVRKEADAIIEAIHMEAQVEGGWGDLFRDAGISADKRFYLALGIQFMQQLSGMHTITHQPFLYILTHDPPGINLVTYYAPTIFQQSLGMSTRDALAMGTYLQVWYFCASFVTWYTIDRVGRRKLFLICATGMGVMLILEAVCVAVNTHASNIAAVVWVFLFVGFFTWGW